MNTIFLRMLAADNKAAALRDTIAAARTATSSRDVYTVDPASFRQVPGAPFAYWVSEDVRHLFRELPQLQSSVRTVAIGGSTKNDFKYLRACWEVPAQLEGRTRVATTRGRRWIPFAKGGAFSRYYFDAILVLDWQNDGKPLKAELSAYRESRGWGPHWTAELHGHDSYFRPGLTYPRRTTSGLSVRVMPAGCIFADKGPTIFVKNDEPITLLTLLAIVNSAPFAALVALQLGAATAAARSYEVGLLQQMPVPELSATDTRVLAALGHEAHDLKRDADRDDEVTHPFTAPALVRLREAGTLRDTMAVLALEDDARERRLAEIQREIDDRCFALYGFSDEDRGQIEGGGGNAHSVMNGQSAGGDDMNVEDEEEPAEAEGEVGSQVLTTHHAADLLMYAVGCAFGRWDIRIGRDVSLAPALAEPFAPLPVCAPGTLIGPDGLPATERRIASEAWLRARPDTITLPPDRVVTQPSITADEYPLHVAWDGILVDDADAPNDIVRRVRAVLDYLWGERADAIEAEVCDILGVRDLRDYFRNPRLFYDFHIKRPRVAQRDDLTEQ